MLLGTVDVDLRDRQLVKEWLLMPENPNEKLEGATQDFVARLEVWLADRPPLSAIRPSVVDVNNAQPKRGLKPKLMNLIKLIASV